MIDNLTITCGAPFRGHQGLPARVRRHLNRAHQAEHLGVSCSRVRSMRSAPNSRRRLRLWMHNPQCHWCGRITILEGKLSYRGNPSNAANTATIDHIKSRLAGRQPGEQTRCVLACDACNRARNAMEQRTVPGYAGPKRVPNEWLRRFMSGLEGDGI